jgi:phosphatidate phosphatase PAH1
VVSCQLTVVCAVRFTKYTGRWTDDRTVKVYVNGKAPHHAVCLAYLTRLYYDLLATHSLCGESVSSVSAGQEMPFTMTLGHDGEVFFVPEHDKGAPCSRPFHCTAVGFRCSPVTTLLTELHGLQEHSSKSVTHAVSPR